MITQKAFDAACEHIKRMRDGARETHRNLQGEYTEDTVVKLLTRDETLTAVLEMLAKAEKGE